VKNQHGYALEHSCAPAPLGMTCGLSWLELGVRGRGLRVPCPRGFPELFLVLFGAGGRLGCFRQVFCDEHPYKLGLADACFPG